eukprot:Platyproteum_vivax@DN4145_c0_g1_i1.p2
MFQQIDTNKDGTITVEEMAKAFETNPNLVSTGMTLLQVFEDLDADGSGRIEYTEFLASLLDKKHIQNEELLWAAFSAFDYDGNGKIEEDDLRKLLVDDKELKSQNIDPEQLMKQFDTDASGEIDFAEFQAMMMHFAGGALQKKLSLKSANLRRPVLSAEEEKVAIVESAVKEDPVEAVVSVEPEAPKEKLIMHRQVTQSKLALDKLGEKQAKKSRFRRFKKMEKKQK